MTKQEIFQWIIERTDATFNFDSSNNVTFVNYTEFKKNIDYFPFPIIGASKQFIATGCFVTSLKNFPLTVGADCDISRNNLTSLEHGPTHLYKDYWVSQNPITTWKFLPEFVKVRMYVGNNNVPDPYEWRYFLYKQIAELDVVNAWGQTSPDEDIVNILMKYLGKPDQFHIAIDELLELGESLGFTYD